jgi:hypothetical protein
MEKNNQTYSMLSEPFPPEMERELRKSGTSLTYIPVSEVITRLNKVIGVDSWSFEIISCGRDTLDPDYIVAHIRMTWYSDAPFGHVTRDGIGGQKIKRTKNGDIVDLGDEMKGAVSDALKKAAQTLGVGLYLARSEDAMYAESYAEASAPQPAVQSVNPEISEIWDAFMSFTKKFNEQQKKQLREDWAEYSDGAEVPKKSTVTLEEAEFLHAQAVAISLEATVVNPE